MRSTTYRELGGYPAVPIMEDVALMTKLKHLRIRLRFTGGFVRSSDRRWRKQGVIRTTLQYWHFILAYRFGMSVDRLGLRYHPHNV